MPNPLKIVFMGTPDFAAHILKQLCCWSDCEVAAVYCQPDRPAGRGKKLVFSAVKQASLHLNIPVLQPINFKKPQDIDTLRMLKPDVLVVAAYGLILPQSVLDIPVIAPLNVHASLLPLYRGAAPIQRAIMDGQAESGVSIMHMEASLDTGPVYAMQSVSIGNHTSSSLHDELAQIGSSLLISVLKKFICEKITPTPQNHELATYAAKLSKHDGVIDWHKPALSVHAHIRGVTPWPGAHISILRPEKEEITLKLTPGTVGPPLAECVHFLPDSHKEILPGQLWRLEKDVLAISTQDKFYIIQSVKPSNKALMLASDFARGYFGPELGFLAYT